MNESEFIENNKAQWEELEKLIASNVRNPDKLEELFTKVSSDLSYARTFYPNRTVRLYLNDLTQQVLDLIQTRKNKFSFSVITNYYTSVLPKELWRARYAFLVSFLVFFIAVAIGALSTAHDLDFTRVILGDEYVEMTNKNINDGDPMAVYKSQDQIDMFWGITLNNIRVSFLAFVLGLFGSVGTIILLLSNGIMLGAFQYFFYKKGLFLTSFLTIWIHGTIEISAIIIAGGAGIILGDGILTPKTHSRSLSLQVASKRAIRVLLSTLPLFIIAGFLESYITRLTDTPTVFKVAIIALSLLFILYHYIFYPYRYQSKNSIDNNDHDVQTSEIEITQLKIKKYLSFAQLNEVTLAQFRIWSATIIKWGILPVMFLCSAGYWIWAKYGAMMSKEFDYYAIDSLFSYSLGGWEILGLYLLCIIHIITIMIIVYKQSDITLVNYIQTLLKNAVCILLLSLPYLLSFYFAPLYVLFLLTILLPPQVIFSTLYHFNIENSKLGKAISQSFNSSYQRYGSYIGTYFYVGFMFYLMLLLSGTLTNVLFVDFLTWHNIFPGELGNHIYIMSLIAIGFSCFALALYFLMYLNQHQSLDCKEESTDLFERIESLNLGLADGQ